MIHDLTVVVPTLNERDNVAPLVARLETALTGVDWEVVFVDDDSTDGTADALKNLARANPRVRVIRRIGRRGLSSACLEGMGSSVSPFLAVIDADLQHDETLLPRMLERMRGGELDIVVGSRYVDHGSIGDWSLARRRISAVATRLSRSVLRAEIADPMSGFFMLRREVFEDVARRVSGKGFKILVDILACAKTPLRVQELPYTFRPRVAGESKLDTLVVWEFVIALSERLIGIPIPVRFIMFVMVGCVGALVHLGVLGVGFRLLDLPFAASQGAATLFAMVTNYFLNNVFTYRDQRLKGVGLWAGLLPFIVICGIGAAVNVAIAERLYVFGLRWWIAGLLGAAVSSVWNYSVSSIAVWGLNRWRAMSRG